MHSRLLAHLKQQKLMLTAPKLRDTSAGGSPLDGETKRRVEACFGMTLHNGYGLTGASPTISQTRMDDRHTSTTVGRVLPLLEYRLEPLESADADAPETGELWADVMRGYFRQPEATRACRDVSFTPRLKSLLLFCNSILGFDDDTRVPRADLSNTRRT